MTPPLLCAQGALPANVSEFGLGNTTVLMASGFNYYWTEAWKIGAYSLAARTASFVATAPLFPGDDSGRTVHPGPHFFIQGSVGFLDEPGEFAMDSDGEWLYYWPRSGLPIEDLEIVAPTSRKPVQIVGPAHDRPVRGLSFRGLEFVCSDQDPEGVWYLFNGKRSNNMPPRFATGLICKHACYLLQRYARASKPEEASCPDTENATDILIEVRFLTEILDDFRRVVEEIWRF